MKKRILAVLLSVVIGLAALPMVGVFAQTTTTNDGSTMSAYADMQLTEITFTKGTRWCYKVYQSDIQSADNPYEVTFEYYLLSGQVTFGSVAGQLTRLTGSSTTLQSGRHTFSAKFCTTADKGTFAPRLSSAGDAVLYIWNFRCTLGGEIISSAESGRQYTTAAATTAAVSGFSWYDGEEVAQELPVTENTALLYNEKHSLYDAQAEELRQAVLNTANQVKPSATGKTYYVSPDGSNQNNGLTPATAWRTPEAVAANATKMQAGDVVLFERGGVYRGTVQMMTGVSYGAYGTGPKPCLYASPRNYADADLWERFAANIWRVDVRYLTDIGNVVFEHGKICASDYKICDPEKMTTTNLKSNYQYYHDLENGYLYMYFNGGNPGAKYSSIEFCPKNNVFRMGDYVEKIEDVTIDNLCVKYTGAHGIVFRTAEDITITNCEIGYIGGSMMNDEVRYGNGIEFNSHVTDALIENNWIYQCFDAGYTNQGQGAQHTDLLVKDNLIEYCNYNIEIYGSYIAEDGTIKGLLKNCLYENNMLRFAGYGFGTNNRFGSNDSATSAICYWRRVIPSENVVIRNNILDTSYRYLVVAAYVNGQREKAPIFTDNVWVQHDGPKSAVALQVDTDVSGWYNHHLYEFLSTDLATMRESVAIIDLNPTEVIYSGSGFVGIVVKTKPKKTAYKKNEALDLSGFALSLVYGNGSAKTVDRGYTVSSFDSSTVGVKTITVTYAGKTTSFTVTVADPASIQQEPTSVTVPVNGQAKMSVVAEGTGLIYRWQEKSPSSAAWEDSLTAGHNTDTITIDATTAHSGYQYCCVITDILGGELISKTATLTVVTPKITAHPQSVTVAANAKPTFTVAASGEELKYQWQVKTSSSAAWKDSTTTGYKTNTITVDATAGRNGYQYRCVITDAAGNELKSNAATLTVGSLKITTQPKNVTAAKGAKSTFTVAASGVGLKYQWQVKTSSSAAWKNSTTTGYNTKTITVDATTGRSGYQYRCTITDAAGNKLDTNAATLTVVTPKIATQPKNVTAAKNAKPTFTVAASGVGLKYQWQVKTSSSAAWKNSTTMGYNTKTITVDATTGRSGYQYRCTITDAAGNKLYTNAVTLTVVSSKITTQSKSVKVAVNAKPTFTVAASGVGLTYQWQVKTSSSAAWKNTTATGNKTKTLTVTANASVNGYQYRCVITDAAGNKLYTNAATLTVVTPKITTQPKSVSVAKNAKPTFTVAATGLELKYQWQVKTSSSAAWKNTTVTGNKTKKITVTANSSYNGYQYRCVITDAAGNKLYTNAANLTVVTPKITTQPKSVSVAKNAKPTFAVAASGLGLKYQWQVKTSSSAAWKNTSVTGNKTKKITVTAYASYNGYQYRCIITDAAGNKLTSNAARLTVVTPKITAKPKSATVAKKTKASFTVAATGVGLKYQWQVRYSSAGAWQNTYATGYNTKTFTVYATASVSGYQYRCVITDAAGNKLTSSAATLTVVSPRITAQPMSEMVAKNAKPKFTVTATGLGLKYQWQVKTSSSAAWKNTTAAGNKTKTLTVTAYSSYNGDQYRCIITDKAGNTVTSSAVSLTVVTSKITLQPKSVTVVKNAKPTLMVAATGLGIKYRWQVKTSSKAAWAYTETVGYNTNVLTPTATTARNGYQYRCVITDAAGNKLYTNVAKMTVKK